ncbi:hypothetical protein CcCBS67573_g02515 [Chytriomyces confervae]|uniref:Uncharacterized protein n=1 Tax=Chytriomyces confervae TaxID=246404 RepID=A0A507FLA0_9FUNG|nr:hypothetical protein CcCBS67573_g02515 [Chytriomyces confervae]
MNQERQRRTSSQSLQPTSANNQTTRPIINRHLHQSSFSSSGSLPNNLGFVTGEPSRAHWKVNTDTNSKPFSMITYHFELRSPTTLYSTVKTAALVLNADPHPAGVTSRICGDCHSEFMRRGEREEEAKRIAAMNASGGDVIGGNVGGGGGVSAALASAGLNYSFPVVGSVPTAGRFGGGRDLMSDHVDLNQEQRGSEGANPKRQSIDSDQSEEADEVGELEKPGRAFASARKPSTVEEPLIAQSVPTDWSWSTF